MRKVDMVLAKRRVFEGEVDDGQVRSDHAARVGVAGSVFAHRHHL